MFRKAHLHRVAGFRLLPVLLLARQLTLLGPVVNLLPAQLSLGRLLTVVLVVDMMLFTDSPLQAFETKMELVELRVVEWALGELEQPLRLMWNELLNDRFELALLARPNPVWVWSENRTLLLLHMTFTWLLLARVILVQVVFDRVISVSAVKRIPPTVPFSALSRF